MATKSPVTTYWGFLVTVSVTVEIEKLRILSRFGDATSCNTEQQETTKHLVNQGVYVVRSCMTLTAIAIVNVLWEQDVGGSNPLAPTTFS